MMKNQKLGVCALASFVLVLAGAKVYTSATLPAEVSAPVTCPATGYFTKDCFGLKQTRIIGGNPWCSVEVSGVSINEGPCDSFANETIAEIQKNSDKYDEYYSEKASQDYDAAKSRSLNKIMDANAKKGCSRNDSTGELKGAWNC